MVALGAGIGALIEIVMRKPKTCPACPACVATPVASTTLPSSANNNPR